SATRWFPPAIWTARFQKQWRSSQAPVSSAPRATGARSASGRSRSSCSAATWRCTLGSRHNAISARRSSPIWKRTGTPPTGANKMKILVLHGPNLNLFGRREPHIYGTTTLAEIDTRLRALADELGVAMETFQSNHEGALVDKFHENIDLAAGALLNPAGLTQHGV